LLWNAERNHAMPMVPQTRRRSPRSPFGQQLGIDRARLIFAEAFLKQRPEPIDAEMSRASVVGAVEKRTVRSVLCHGLPLDKDAAIHIGKRSDAA
jgi:hypothetical protein